MSASTGRPPVEYADLGHVRIAYERWGSPDDPTILLVTGSATQMIHWYDDFVRQLAAAGPFQVVRYDHRDSGLSTLMRHHKVPNLALVVAGYLAGRRVKTPYTLSDMAADGVGVLDAIGVDRAHVVGFSMGGAVAQMIAVDHPGRVASLVSMASTSGALRASVAKPRGVKALMRRMPRTRRQAEDIAIRWRRAVSGSLGVDELRERDLAKLAWDRCSDADGYFRQMAALFASGDRTPLLGRIRAPTLVVHGADDPLLPPSAGRSTQQAIPGAAWLELPGMGHDMPDALWPRLVEALVAHARRAPAGDG